MQSAISILKMKYISEKHDKQNVRHMWAQHMSHAMITHKELY